MGDVPSSSGAEMEAESTCEASSMMAGGTESISSQSSQDTAAESSAGGKPETVSSQSSQSTLSEKEVSIWLDEKEEQQAKRQGLNDCLNRLTDGRVSPLQSTLNTEWEDISSTQQKYYTRKARKMVAATPSVI